MKKRNYYAKKKKKLEVASEIEIEWNLPLEIMCAQNFDFSRGLEVIVVVKNPEESWSVLNDEHE